jgi:hypothetical protein
MRRAIPLVASALSIALLLPGSTLAAAGGSDLPVRGSHVGYMTMNVATLQTHAVTTGWVSHFGATTMEQDVQGIPTGPTTRSFTGTWTMTLASGDQIFGTSSGEVGYQDSTHLAIVGEYLSTGGTGRLANTSMAMSVTVEATVVSFDGSSATLAVEVTVTGRMSH